MLKLPRAKTSKHRREALFLFWCFQEIFTVSQILHKIMGFFRERETYFKGCSTWQSIVPAYMCQHKKSLHLAVLRYDSKSGRKLMSWKAAQNLSAVQAKPNFSESRMLDYSVGLSWLPWLWEGDWPELKWKPGQSSWRSKYGGLAAMGTKCGVEVVTTALGVASIKILSTCPLEHSQSFWVLEMAKLAEEPCCDFSYNI